MHGHQHNMKGAVLMMASAAGFVLNDTMIKWVAEDLLLYQTIFLRGFWATLFIGGLAWHQGVLSFRPDRHDTKIIVIRTFADTVGTFCFLTALFNMPLAIATAILQSLPLAVTLAASIFLGEKVGWRRYVAIIIGFMGVMLIIRPGTSGFNAYSLVALAAVIFVTLRELTTRRLTEKAPTVFVALWNSIIITAIAGVFSVFQGWNPVSFESGISMTIAAAFIILGYIAGVAAMRNGEIAFVSPFRFSALIWALVIGMALFGERLDFWSATGSIIVVGMGVFTFYREQKQMKAIRKT